MLKKVNLPKKALKAYLFTQKSTKKVLKKSKFPQKRSQTSIFPQNRDEKSCRCCRYLFWVILGHFWTNFCANFFRQNIALCYSNHFLQLCLKKYTKKIITQKGSSKKLLFIELLKNGEKKVFTQNHKSWAIFYHTFSRLKLICNAQKVNCIEYWSQLTNIGGNIIPWLVS